MRSENASPLLYIRVPIIFLKNRDISIFPLKTGTFGKKRDTKKFNKNKKSIVHFILNIEKLKHTKNSSKCLI
jgi:hypothetical protein